MRKQSKRKRYNKLVRDKIPQLVRRRGGLPIVRIAKDEEYGEKLKEKLTEEVQEFQASETTEELADILEVIDAIADYKGFTKKEILAVKTQKARQRGRFEKRIILIES